MQKTSASRIKRRVELLDELEAIAAELERRRGIGDPAPLFTDFVAQLGVALEPGQRVLCRVAFDGVEPHSLDDVERTIARRLFGNVDVIPPGCRRVLVAVCGARAGKTYVLIALRILHLALTVDLSPLAPGEEAFGVILAPHTDLSAQGMRYVQGAIDSLPWLKRREVHRIDEESSTLERDGKRVTIVAKAANAQGLAGRGLSLVAAALDECAFFRDRSYKVNDDELYKAFAPRVMPGGQSIIASTPWAESGLLYELFRSNHGHPVNALAAHAPTLALRDVEYTRELVANETARDPENAEREYGARFMGAGTEQFFDAAVLRACIDPSLSLPMAPVAGTVVTAGGDLGFTRNSAALAICHRRGRTVSLAELVEEKPLPGMPLKPSAVTGAFAARLVAHGAASVECDKHYQASMVEACAAAGIIVTDAPTQPADAFVDARTMMREGLVKLPDDPRLLGQLREVMWRKNAGGTVTIVQPQKKTGEHGDLASALVLALHQHYGAVTAPTPPAQGTPEAEREEEAAMEREYVRSLTERKRHWSLRR